MVSTPDSRVESTRPAPSDDQQGQPCVSIRADAIARTRIVETDARGRVSLKKLGVEGHTYYEVTVLQDDTVILEPVVVRSRRMSVEDLGPEQLDRIAADEQAGFVGTREALDAMQSRMDHIVVKTDDED